MKEISRPVSRDLGFAWECEGSLLNTWTSLGRYLAKGDIDHARDIVRPERPLARDKLMIDMTFADYRRCVDRSFDLWRLR